MSYYVNSTNCKAAAGSNHTHCSRRRLGNRLFHCAIRHDEWRTTPRLQFLAVIGASHHYWHHHSLSQQILPNDDFPVPLLSYLRTDRHRYPEYFHVFCRCPLASQHTGHDCEYSSGGCLSHGPLCQTREV